MPPPPPAPEEQMSEVELLQFKANQTTDQSLDSTRRMLALCEESKEAGIRTLVALDDQGEQLDRVEKGMKDINEDMREAEKAMKGMGGCCFGLCPTPELPWNKGPEHKEDKSTWKTNEDGKVCNTEPNRGISDAGIPTYGGFVSKITNDAREDEMENNMEQVSIMVGNLRNMAVDMGSEVENQNRQLDRVNLQAESNMGRIGAANEKATKLLK